MSTIVDLQPAEAAANDTYIDLAAPTTNYATNALLKMGVPADGSHAYGALLKFDLSALSAIKNILVITAQITLNGEAVDGGNYLYCFRLIRDWVESQATATIRSTGNNWNAVGLTNGVDFSGSLGHGSIPSSPGNIYLSLDKTIVQKMIKGTYTNYGFFLATTPGLQYTNLGIYANCTSSSGADSAKWPKLRIVYKIAGGSPITMIM